MSIYLTIAFPCWWFTVFSLSHYHIYPVYPILPLVEVKVKNFNVIADTPGRELQAVCTFPGNIAAALLHLLYYFPIYAL